MITHSLLRFSIILIFSLSSSLLLSCASHTIQQSAPLNPHSTWIFLPLLNHSDSPEAGERIADIAATLLRSERHINLLPTQMPITDTQLPELNTQKLVDQAIQWGKSQQYQYGIGGSVQEWHYKSGLDGEPAVGITFTVVDLTTGSIVWSATGAKTGWGRASLSGTGQELISELFAGLPLTE